MTSLISNSQVSVYFDTNRQANVYLSDGPTNTWVAFSDSAAIVTGNWVRLTISLDYTIANTNLCKVQIDGVALTNAAHPDAWFRCAASSS